MNSSAPDRSATAVVYVLAAAFITSACILAVLFAHEAGWLTWLAARLP